MDWVKAYLSIWTELQNYIKQHHTTGLAWSKSVSPFNFTISLLMSVQDGYTSSASTDVVLGG